MIFRPHSYQTRAIEFILEHEFCGLFLDMGLGKTVATLTALDKLLYERLESEKVLVVAPKSVALNTWSNEANKWDHLRCLRMSIVMGSAAKRRKALEQPADIYVTNRDNVVWLRNEGEWTFDTVVLDESSSFKNFQSRRWKALWSVRPQIRRMILLTGTPAPNGLMDLWAQVKLLDRGVRLGRFITQFREAYFRPGARSGAVVYDWLPKPGAQELITDKISDICMSMRAEDYLDIPDLIDAGMVLELPELEKYKQFERDCVLSLEDGDDVLALTAVSLTNKLLQFASGAVYDDEHSWHEVSSAKQEALSELLEQTSEPVLLFYNYRHELERIQRSFPDAVPFRGEPDILQRWDTGEIRLLLCHPASVAYGLNMQQGGHIIVWYSPTWNLELYEQANARLHRQGQSKPVMLYHLICRGTMDEVVMSALSRKDNVQGALMRHLASIREDKLNK